MKTLTQIIDLNFPEATASWKDRDGAPSERCC